jgi:hypothetical protein
MSRPTGPKRFGYLVAVAVNVALLHVVHQLLEWGWPDFVTDEFNDVLPIISVTLVASIVANAAYFWFDADWFTALGAAVTSAIGFAAAVRLLQVFPFDFSTYDTDWSWLVRLLLVIAIAGSAISFAVNVVKFMAFMARRTAPESHIRWSAPAACDNNSTAVELCI